MKMFLTRLGFGSRIVVTGDVTQVDLPSGTHSGLRVVEGILDEVEDISFCRLTAHDELRPGLVNEDPEEGILGDLMLCPAVAERQAVTAGHTTDAELELLTVHGILHLLGYDHAEPEEHAEMFGLQDELLDAWRSGPR